VAAGKDEDEDRRVARSAATRGDRDEGRIDASREKLRRRSKPPACPRPQAFAADCGAARGPSGTLTEKRGGGESPILLAQPLGAWSPGVAAAPASLPRTRGRWCGKSCRWRRKKSLTKSVRPGNTTVPGEASRRATCSPSADCGYGGPRIGVGVGRQPLTHRDAACLVSKRRDSVRLVSAARILSVRSLFSASWRSSPGSSLRLPSTMRLRRDSGCDRLAFPPLTLRPQDAVRGRFAPFPFLFPRLGDLNALRRSAESWATADMASGMGHARRTRTAWER